jgi:hypothetical protein
MYEVDEKDQVVELAGGEISGSMESTLPLMAKKLRAR